MATAPSLPGYAVQSALASLSGIEGVLSVHTRWLDNVLNIWIGVRDDAGSRDSVYLFEDSFLNKFSELSVEFHVLTIPDGRRIEDFISDAQSVYQRIA